MLRAGQDNEERQTERSSPGGMSPEEAERRSVAEERRGHVVFPERRSICGGMAGAFFL